MSTSTTTASASSIGYQGESIRHLPATAQEAFVRFRSSHDPAALDTILLAILEDFMPKPPACPLAEMSGDTRLIDDLNYDSIIITEVVFFAEDLFDITITNKEIIQVSTLDALRSFIRAKVDAQSAS